MNPAKGEFKLLVKIHKAIYIYVYKGHGKVTHLSLVMEYFRTAILENKNCLEIKAFYSRQQKLYPILQAMFQPQDSRHS